MAGVHTSSARNLEYGYLAFVLGERTTPRLTSTSKIITVDGNLSSGKGVVAEKLAAQLGMLYMPEPDQYYMDKLNGEKTPLGEEFNGMCSLEKFYTNPKAADGNSYRLQLWMYAMRLLQYSNALEHLITTQGVIMERSIYSDFVFLEAMHKMGYIRKQCVDHYNELKGISITHFLPPHLTIYVDQPADVQRKLKQSSKPYLQNVPLEYLKAIEDSYKKNFLPEIEKTSEVLVYDVPHSLDVDRIAEDFEYLKFEKGPWPEQDDASFHHLRMLVQNKFDVINLVCVPSLIPEITIGGQEFDANYFKYKGLPGKKYARGYNEDVGDKYIWLK